jgi:hypothetical protein
LSAALRQNDLAEPGNNVRASWLLKRNLVAGQQDWP